MEAACKRLSFASVQAECQSRQSKFAQICPLPLILGSVLTEMCHQVTSLLEEMRPGNMRIDMQTSDFERLKKGSIFASSQTKYAFKLLYSSLLFTLPP